MIAIAPVGGAPDGVLAAMEQALASAFGLPAARLGPIEEPARAYFAPRAQWSAVVFLETLLARAPAAPGRLLGVTERDLFVPVLSFVYGQAQLAGRVAVVSLARLRPEFHGLAPSPGVLERRAATEAVHEVGHTFGLVHCAARSCPMSLSIDLADLDAKTARPCPGCRALVEESPEMRRCRDARTEGAPP